jgi:hypothetical protein
MKSYLSIFVILQIMLSGCSSAGPGFAHHPMDCAAGIAWADCLPGTAGYNNAHSGQSINQTPEAICRRAQGIAIANTGGKTGNVVGLAAANGQAAFAQCMESYGL